MPLSVVPPPHTLLIIILETPPTHTHVYEHTDGFHAPRTHTHTHIHTHTRARAHTHTHTQVLYRKLTLQRRSRPVGWPCADIPASLSFARPAPPYHTHTGHLCTATLPIIYECSSPRSYLLPAGHIVRRHFESTCNMLLTRETAETFCHQTYYRGTHFTLHPHPHAARKHSPGQQGLCRSV